MRRTIAAFLALALSACATTDQADDVSPSGFLEDTSRLEPGLPGEPLLVWAAPDPGFGTYGPRHRPLRPALPARQLEGLGSPMPWRRSFE